MKLLSLVVLFISLKAQAAHVVFIPGAASSAGKISISYTDEVFGRVDQFDYFDFLTRKLKEAGHQVSFCPRIPDNDRSSLGDRANDCADYLRTQCQNQKIILIGHSMGGLIGRMLLSKRELKGCFDSLVTISTPHFGTTLANAIFNEDDHDVMRVAARVLELTPEHLPYAKELIWPRTQIITNPWRVPIYSITNESRNFISILPMKLTAIALEKELRRHLFFDVRNDGVVPTTSMKFGKHLAHIKANHLESACILQSQFSKGCKQVLKTLLTFLEK